MWCSDPFQTALRRLGYCVVSLPRENLSPLLLLQRNGGRFEPIGPLSDILTADAIAAPVIEADSAVAGLSSLRTGQLRTGLGISVLGGVVAALGGKPDTLQAGFSKVKSLTLELKDVREDRVNVTAVEQYLTAADVKLSVAHTSRLLNVGAIYLIVAVLKSSQLDVETEAKDSGSAAVNVKSLEAAGINGQVHFERGTGRKDRVSYIGDRPLVFAFKAIQLSYRNGRFDRYVYVDPKAATMGGSSHVASAADVGLQYLLPDSPFLDLE